MFQKEKKICYINYINRKHNNGEIRHQDFCENNFEYVNITEIENTYNDEPIMLMDYISKYSYLYDIVIINLNNVDRNIEEIMINNIEAIIEYLLNELELRVPRMIYINKNKIMNKVYKPLYND